MYNAYFYPSYVQTPLPVPLTPQPVFVAPMYAAPMSEPGNKRARVNTNQPQSIYSTVYHPFSLQNRTAVPHTAPFYTAPYALPSPYPQTRSKQHPQPPHHQLEQNPRRGSPQSRRPDSRTAPAPRNIPGPAPPPNPPSIAPQPGPNDSPFFTKLHHEITETTASLSLTPTECRQRQDIIQAIQTALQAAFPRQHARLKPFGSFASGLSLHSSDLDLVITGLMEPDESVGFFQQDEKPIVCNYLSQLSRALYRSGALRTERQFMIRNARIPLIKLRTTTGVDVDISIGGEYGPKAAAWAQEQAQRWPQMKALVLLLKALLGQQGLNDTSTGGLSSYSITNMVVAHLQTEARKGPLPGLGKLLHSFLDRFGRTFDYTSQVVSVRRGGLTTQREAGLDVPVYGLRLVLQCPLSGREVAGGSYRLDMVQSAFERAAEAIERLDKGGSWQREQGGGKRLLDAVMDTKQAVSRGGGEDEARGTPPGSHLRKRARDEDDDA